MGLGEPVRDLLRRYGLDAKKALGQNFLALPAYAERIVAAAGLAPGDTVLEVGPGPGVLTGRLAAQVGAGGRVVAVELDERFVALLRREHAETPQVQIVHADILKHAPARLLASEEAGAPPYVVVANLPYYITSHALRHLLESDPPPLRAVLMVQKEVAERIVAAPGDLSVLGVSVQYYAEPQLLFTVPAAAFYPAPKVESAVVRLVVRPQPAVPDVPRARFFRVVRAGFGQKRKQLANSLSGGLALPKAEAARLLTAAGIDPARRAETLSLDEWGALARQIGELVNW